MLINGKLSFSIGLLKCIILVLSCRHSIGVQHNENESQDCSTSCSKERTSEAKWVSTINEEEGSRIVHEQYRRNLNPKENSNVRFGVTDVFQPSQHSSAKCREQSAIFLEELRNYKLWALLMYDASAKIPSGILQGNGHQLGYYDQCLSVKALKPESQKEIRGKYCLASVDLEVTSEKEDLKEAVFRAESYRTTKSNINNTLGPIPRTSTFVWGVCLPAGCSAHDLKLTLEEKTQHLSETAGIALSFAVREENCVDSEHMMKASPSYKTFLTVFLLLFPVLLSICGTYIDETKGASAEVATNQSKNYDHDTKPELLKRFVLLFSLKRTIPELLEPVNVEKEITCVHGFKAIFAIIIYYLHKVLYCAGYPYANKSYFSYVLSLRISTLLRSGILLGDAFFAMSGLILAYTLTGDALTKKLSFFGRVPLRLIRLFPLSISLVLFYAYVIEHLGDGPLWNGVVGREAESCKATGWTNFLFVPNINSFSKICSINTHQLAIDFQLSLAVPFIIYLMYNYNIFGYLMMIAAIIGVNIHRYNVVLSNGLTMIISNNIEIETHIKMANLIHFSTIMRSGAYLVGVLAGYFLRIHKKDRHGKLNTTYANVGSFIALATYAAMMISIADIGRYDYAFDKSFGAFTAATFTLATAIILCYFICVFHLGYGKTVNKFLIWKPFVILSRSSYAFYLFQFPIFHYVFGSLRTSQTFSVLGLFDISDIFAVLISIVLTLTFEMPINKVRSLIKESMSPSQKIKSS